MNVEIILDRASSAAHNNATYFSSLNGIRTWLDAKHSVADSNVIIIEKATVITGSFNFTKEAEDRNAENPMIVRSERVADTYLANWNLHRGHADDFKAGGQATQQDAKSERKPAKKKKKTNKPG